jgi:hypothetical protein
VDRVDRDSLTPYLLLAGALAASVVLLMVLSSGLTFFQDTWAFLIQRRPFDARAFFEPHNEHIVVIPVVIEKSLIAIFGMTSALPEYIVLNVLLVVTAVLVFVYVQRRLGPWPALLGTVLLLFLGPAWQVMLWPFEISLVGSTMAGLAMLLVLEREDRRGDVAACVLLVISIGFSSLGLPFAVGAVVDVLQRRRTRGLGRFWIPAVGLVLYAVWYVAIGHEAKTPVTAHNVIHSPIFVAEGLSGSVGALTGLTSLSGDPGGIPWLGFAALVAIAVAIAWVIRRPPAISSRFWPLAATAAAFWFLAAFARDAGGRDALASRYMHVGAILLLLGAADLLHCVRFSRRALLVGAAVVVAAMAVNFREFRDGRDYLKEQTILTKADTGALEIARRTAGPAFYLAPEWAGTGALINVNAPEYFPAVDEYGSPADSPSELARAPEVGRVHADLTLAAALPITAAVAPGAGFGAGCVLVPGGAGEAGREVRLSPGVTRIALAPGSHAGLALRRFAVGEYPVVLESAPGASVTELTIPRDRSPRPWLLRVKATQPARVCRQG